jgi:hypothetical protein
MGGLRALAPAFNLSSIFFSDHFSTLFYFKIAVVVARM